MSTPNDAKHEPAAEQAGTDPATKLVLVVEDEPTISRIVVSYLEREGYRTEVAHDGLQASQFVHTVKPDLVILDVMLPGRSGLDVLRRLRSTASSASSSAPTTTSPSRSAHAS